MEVKGLTKVTQLLNGRVHSETEGRHSFCLERKKN